MLTSGQNPKVKQILRLRERRERDETGRFLIEGYRELKQAADAQVPLETLFFCAQFFLGTNEPALIEQIEEGGTLLFPCAPHIFEKISYRDRPDGLLGIGVQQVKGLKELARLLETRPNPFLVIAESIEKPGNLGTILRSADAVGVDALIVCDKCTDIYNPNTVRASVGTLFTVPIIEGEGAEVRSFLKERSLHIVAATPAAQTSFTDADLTGPIAIAVGTEQLGLSPPWLAAADLRVSIPMRGAADSLNVAMATTLLLYEALRQRT